MSLLATIAVVLSVLAFWGGVVWYDLRTYTLDDCTRCGGRGRLPEPRWMALMCFRLRRRSRYCPTCGGKGRFDLRSS